MAKEKKKGAIGRSGTPSSTPKKPVEPKAAKAKTTTGKPATTKRTKPAQARGKPVRPKSNQPKKKTTTKVTAVRPTLVAPSLPTEPFFSKGPPPDGGRRTEITRAQALFLLRIPGSDEVIGDAQHFLVLEWRGLLPAGFPVKDDYLGDLDETEDIARNEGGAEIGRYRLLDVPWDNAVDDDTSPGFMALIWY
jgi:hypothetical protein